MQRTQWIALLVLAAIFLLVDAVALQKLGAWRLSREHQVLVSTVAVARGGRLETGTLTWQTFLNSMPTTQYITEATSQLTNLNEAIVLQPIKPNQPITRDSVIPVTSGAEYANVLDPGMRAISVPLQAGAANTNLIQPGVRVDVVLTFTPTGNGLGLTPPGNVGVGGGGGVLGGGLQPPSSGIAQYISRTLLHNV